MTQVALPVATDLWVSQRDLEISGLAIAGSVKFANVTFDDHELGKSVQGHLVFELNPAYQHLPGDPNADFRTTNGVKDPSWISRATGKILRQDGEVVVEYVLHNRTKGFVLRFFDRPDPHIWHPTHDLL